MYCFRIGRELGGYYGFGDTPEMAFKQALRAANKFKAPKSWEGKGWMVKVPEGVTDVCINEFGSLSWNGSSSAKLTTYYRDSSGKWVEDTMDEISRETYQVMKKLQKELDPLDESIKYRLPWEVENFEAMLAELERTTTEMKLLKERRIKQG